MDLDFGEMPEQNKAHNDDPITHHLGQAFLRYRFKEFSDTIFTAGKFYSHFGLEVPKSIDNKTYSRPFYFTLICPFWHEGISLTKSGIGPFSVGAYFYDRTDDRVDNNAGKTLGGQVSVSKDNLSATYNIISGPEKDSSLNSKEGNLKTIHEVILNYQLNDRVQLISDTVWGVNRGADAGTGKDQKWYGLVEYVDVKTSERNSLCLRVEHFFDKTSASAANNLLTTNVLSPKPTRLEGYTLTNRYNLNNSSEIRVEFRYDVASQKVFPTKKDEFIKDQSTITVGWLYSI